VRDDGKDLRRSGLDELSRSEADRATGVGHVVDEDGDLADDRADEHHPRLEARWRATKVSESAMRERIARRKRSVASRRTTSLAFLRSLWNSAKSTSSRSAMLVALEPSRAISSASGRKESLPMMS